MVNDCVTTLFTCDICGSTEEALTPIKPGDVFDRESPTGWTVGYNPNVHICPKCDQKLHSESYVCSKCVTKEEEEKEDEFTEDTPGIVLQAALLKQYCAKEDSCVNCLLNETGTEDTVCLLKHSPVNEETCKVYPGWIEAESRFNLHEHKAEAGAVRDLIDHCDETKCEDCCFHTRLCELSWGLPEDWDLNIEQEEKNDKDIKANHIYM